MKNVLKTIVLAGCLAFIPSTQNALAQTTNETAKAPVEAGVGGIATKVIRDFFKGGKLDDGTHEGAAAREAEKAAADAFDKEGIEERNKVFGPYLEKINAADAEADAKEKAANEAKEAAEKKARADAVKKAEADYKARKAAKAAAARKKAADARRSGDDRVRFDGSREASDRATREARDTDYCRNC